MLWEILQQRRIEDVRRVAEEAKGESRGAVEISRDQAERVRHLALATQAVWSFLKEKHQLDDQDLLRRMEEIDVQDGRKDGRAAGQSGPCPSCGRQIHDRHPACLYCGAENPRHNPFAD